MYPLELKQEKNAICSFQKKKHLVQTRKGHLVKTNSILEKEISHMHTVDVIIKEPSVQNALNMVDKAVWKISEDDMSS